MLSSQESLEPLPIPPENKIRIFSPITFRPNWRHLLHVVLLVALCLVCFSRNKSRLFESFDGGWRMTTIKIHREWSAWALRTPSSPFEALGSPNPHCLTYLSPAYVLFGLLENSSFDPSVFAYTVVAIELFLAMLFFGRAWGLSRNWAYLSAWGLTFIVLPFQAPRIYPIANIVPEVVELMAGTLVFSGLLAQFAKPGWLRNIGCAVLAGLVGFWMAMFSPGFGVLTVPALFCCAAATVVAAKPLSARCRQLFLTALVVLILGLSTGPYLLGNLLYSVPSFFSHELVNVRMSRELISIAFGFDSHFGRAGPVIIIAAALGACVAYTTEVGKLRSLAAFSLVALAVVVIIGSIIVFKHQGYQGPSPIYFEWFLWPHYGIWASYLAIRLTNRLPVFLARPWREWQYTNLIIPGSFCMIAFLGRGKRAAEENYYYPPCETQISRILSAEASLAGDKQFQGYVVSLFRNGKPGNVTWFDQLNIADLAARRAGNDCLAMGLWYHGIGTVFQYGQFITPPYYLLMTRLLSDPETEKQRNVVQLTTARLPFLRSLGVRFVIADHAMHDLEHGGEVVLRATEDLGAQSLYLYEIQGVNAASFSPTTVHHVSSASEALLELTDVTFDFRTTALLEETDIHGLVPVTSSSMRAVHDGWHIEARSEGHSLLLLPLQYSHCLNLENLKLDRFAEVKVVRVNLLQAGILFSGKLSATIRFMNGPFHNPFGRVRDYLDMKRMGFGKSAGFWQVSRG